MSFLDCEKDSDARLYSIGLKPFALSVAGAGCTGGRVESADEQWHVSALLLVCACCCILAYSLDLHFHSFVHVMSGAHGETPPPPLLASVTLILSLNFPGSDVFQEHL